ncbi:hypothetical protein MBLNU230_g7801t1 [Neophaeotheca triangularis]
MAEVLSPPSSTSTATSRQDECSGTQEQQQQHQRQQPLTERHPQEQSAETEASAPPNTQALPQPIPRATQTLERIPSFAQNRMSSYSTHSQSSRSRTPSVFPTFKSHLNYAQVRDFAYPPFHPNHHGPPPEPPSGSTTPGSEWNTSGRRLSDPMESGLGSSRGGGWSAGVWGGDGGIYGEQQHHFSSQEGVEPLPSTSFGSVNDDEDDLSASGASRSQHRKSKSYTHLEDFHRGRRRSSQNQRRSSREQDIFHFHGSASGQYRRDSHTHAHSLPSRSFHHSQPQTLQPEPHSDLPLDSEPLPSPPSTGHFRSSMSPSDEELFAGPSLALYSFEPENANELKLTEGQTILVSYRHGQGWLVAEDPVSGEQGLVPEEYVRLLREIEGWDEEEGMEGEIDMGEGEGFEEEGASEVGFAGEEGKGRVVSQGVREEEDRLGNSAGFQSSGHDGHGREMTESDAPADDSPRR